MIKLLTRGFSRAHYDDDDDDDDSADSRYDDWGDQIDSRHIFGLRR